MGNFLFKKFIKNYEDVKNPEVRDSYGKLAGIVGILSNLLLCVMKMLVGFISGSIAIVADAVNNLADASSSVITLVGFKLAALPEDKEHPYGHARIEYIAGMVVSLIIIIVGVELGKSSFEKILHPEPLEFSISVVIVLLLAIAIKVWQAMFNVSAGKKINSLTLIATGTDSRNDVIATSAVLISIIAGYIFDIQIDGYMGVLVALFIVWSGISLVRETISPLLGEAPDPELVNEIEDIVMSYDGVIGIHDLVVHNYGPGKIFASIHIEVDAAVDVMVSHDLVDNIEGRLQQDLNIFVTAHMDPVNLGDPNREPLTHVISDAISGLEGVLNFHDLRIVPGPTHTNVVFDVVLSPECHIDRQQITDIISERVQNYNPSFFCVINYDMSYV
ncbi:MAG: cation diffusion facilitator family transporter [Anaerovoracaceae bacterium]